jgi:CRP-like cAMP-binding protein
MESVDLAKIKKLNPFKKMNESEFRNVMRRARLLLVPKGKMIFKRADEDSNLYWLVSGSVDLLDGNFDAKNRKAGGAAARNPIDNNSPHLLTAVSKGKLKVLILERKALGNFIRSKKLTPSKRRKKEKEVDWMSALISSPLFEFIPPTNIQKLFGKFEALKVTKGTAVIKQGGKGDFFYVIQSGSAKVERKSGNKTVVLAVLHAGDNFGQDALVSDIPRNATVTMITNGRIRRLSAPDFESLLMEPVIETMDMDETVEMIKQGDPKTYIIDVRNAKEVEADKIANSLNVPLLLLRKNAPRLSKDAIYVMAGEGGKRAELGAYILNEKGLTAYVLKREVNA